MGSLGNLLLNDNAKLNLEDHSNFIQYNLGLNLNDGTSNVPFNLDISINNVAISSINNRIDNPDLVTNILSNPNDVGIIDVYSTRNTTPSSLSINVGVKSVQIQGHKKETSVDNTGIRLIVDGVESDQIIDFPTQVVEDHRF